MIVFEDRSQPSTLGAEIVQWDWDFGELGRTDDKSSDRHPTHTYAAPGSYEVTLTVTDALGASGRAKRTVEVNSAPDATFIASLVSGKAPLTVTFDGPSVDADVDGSIISWAWDFGDKEDPDTTDQAAGEDPTYTYETPGTYTARLTVTDDDGATAEHSVQITVAQPNVAPSASFTATSLTGAAPFEPTFTSTATDGDGSIVKHEWSFGDGTSATGATVSHRYAGVGRYPVKLTVTDDSGATASATQDVVVTLPPEVFEEIPPPAEGEPAPPTPPTLQKILTDLLERTRGPCSVRMLTDSSLVVCGGDRRRSLRLRTWAVNAGPSARTVRLWAVERLPRGGRARKAAKRKRVRYRARRTQMPAFGSERVVLKPPRKLRRVLVRKLKRRGRVARRPVVKLRTADGTTKMPHRVVVRMKKKR